MSEAKDTLEVKEKAPAKQEKAAEKPAKADSKPQEKAEKVQETKKVEEPKVETKEAEPAEKVEEAKKVEEVKVEAEEVKPASKPAKPQKEVSGVISFNGRMAYIPGGLMFNFSGNIEVVGTFGDFVQVNYVRPGFGIAKAFVRKEDIQ